VAAVSPLEYLRTYSIVHMGQPFLAHRVVGLTQVCLPSESLLERTIDRDDSPQHKPECSPGEKS
jgi:hypothetical protein